MITCDGIYMRVVASRLVGIWGALKMLPMMILYMTLCVCFELVRVLLKHLGGCLWIRGR